MIWNSKKGMYFMTQDIKHIPRMKKQKEFQIQMSYRETSEYFINLKKKYIRENRVEFQKQENLTHLRLYRTPMPDTL